ncbi:MAG: hypothetical protein WBQ44_01655 [Rhodococcus sp. (in: high G+C Gram-positive bacteria)]
MTNTATHPFPGAASLVNSTCTFEAYYDKLYASAPAVAWTLDADRDRRTALEQFFALSPEQRQLTVERWAA